LFFLLYCGHKKSIIGNTEDTSRHLKIKRLRKRTTRQPFSPIANVQEMAAALPDRKIVIGQKIVRKTNAYDEEYEESKDFLSLAKFKQTTSSMGSEDFPSLPPTQKKTAPGKKENTTSFPQQYNVAIQSTKKMTPLSSENFSLPNLHYNIQNRPGKITQSASHGPPNKKKGQKIFEIVRNLVGRDEYVYGYWQCHKCKFEWTELYNQPSLQKCLKQTQENLYTNFNKVCQDCRKNSFITSFRLHTHSLSVNSRIVPITEIIVHLQWEKYYRVFGEWECPECQREWQSAYTWISLQRFIKKIPGHQLTPENYCMQACKNNQCKKDSKSNIIFYKPLDMGEGSEHKRKLCAKCLSGDFCVESGYYLGYEK
ncbi:1737_t:CDS:2, partial [Acaulospora morrowiae]